MVNPFLTALNADHSMLLTTGTGKQIAIDAWLDGPNIEGHRWLHHDEHVSTPSCIKSFKQLDRLDAIVCSLEFDDHCNKNTLLQADPSTPIFGPAKACKLIRKWNHFDHITEIPFLSPSEGHIDWLKEAAQPFPDVRLFILPSRSKHPFPLHHTLVVAMQINDSWKALLYSPHGTTAANPDLPALANLSPPLLPTILCQGLNKMDYPFLLGGTANLGIEESKEVAKKLLPSLKYWIPIHDEIKICSAFTGWATTRTVGEFEKLSEEDKNALKNVKLLTLASGQKLELEI